MKPFVVKKEKRPKHVGYCAYCDWTCERFSFHDVTIAIIEHTIEVHGEDAALKITYFPSTLERDHIAVVKK
jgi:hypothetical protein